MQRPRVYLRLRPPLSSVERNDILFGEINENNTEITYTKQSEKTGTRKTKTTIRFDKIFQEDIIQEDLFNNMNNDIINNLINGYTIGLIMYGATGSGKTYSLDGKLGDVVEQGLLPRIIQSSINEISNLSNQYRITLSCIQIYNGKIEDMLGQDKNLNKSSDTLNHAAKNIMDGNFVTVMKMYTNASKKRHVGTNIAHSQSSRSHAITQLTFYWTPKDSNVEKVSNIIFVDLAGSEENLEITNNGDPTTINQRNINVIARNQEGKFIKQGLLHFKNVMRDIVSSNKKGGGRTVLNCGNTLTQVLDHLLHGESIINVLLCISNRMKYSIDNTKTLGTGTDILQLPITPKVNKIKQEMALIDTITEQQGHIADLQYELEKARETAIEAEFTKETEKLNQISQKTEIIELQSQLNELRNQFIIKDEEVKCLYDINCDLEIAKEKLIKLVANNVPNNNKNKSNNNNKIQQHSEQIKKLQKEIETKEKNIQDINTLELQLEQKLEIIISKQQAREKLTKNIQQLEAVDPRTEEIKLNISSSKAALQENENIIELLNTEITKIYKRKEELENEVTRLKSRVDAKLDAEKNYKKTLDKLRGLDNEMKLLVDTIKQIPHTTPPSEQLIELESYKTTLEDEIKSTGEEVKKNKIVLTTTTLNLDIALKSLPEDLRIKVEHAIPTYQQQEEGRDIIKEQEQAILNELKELDVDDDVDDNDDNIENNYKNDENNNKSNVERHELGRNLAQDLIRLREIEQNDELKSLIQRLPYNIDKVNLFLSFHPSCKERFFELGGLSSILKYLPLVIHVSTFSSLCELLGNCLFDDRRLYDTIQTSNIFQTIETWFIKSEWIEYGEGAHVRTLDAISALCTTKRFQNELKSCTNILRIVLHFVVNSEVQSIICSACRCLALLSPSESFLKQLEVKNFTTFISNICISLINHLSNPSMRCRKEASFCISKLYVESIFKITFENHQILKYVINAIMSQKSIDSTASQAYSVLLLTLIESSHANNTNNNINTDEVKKLAYESLALGFVTRVSTDDIESIRITGVSPELPYTAEVIRGEWNMTTSGGPITHGFFFDNPMYTLVIPSQLSTSNNNNNNNDNQILVTFALKKMPSRHPSEQDKEIINSRRTSYANLRIAPLSAILEDIQFNVQDSTTLKNLVIEEIKNGKIPISSMCFKYYYETSYPTDNVYTFSLIRGETYIIIPQAEVRCIHEHYIMCIVADSNFILQEQKDTMKKQLFNGLFPLPDLISKKYEGHKHPSWKNFPQILIEPTITKPEMLIAMVSYLDSDNEYDNLYLYHDEILQAKQLREKYSTRPKFTMKIFDVTNTSKRVVYYSNFESSSYWMSSTWSLLYANLLPGHSYIISICLVGEYDKTEKLPFRLQFFTTQCDINFTPLTREYEWYSFTEVYRLSSNPLQISLLPLSSNDQTSLLRNLNDNPETASMKSKLSGNSLILIFRLCSKEPRKLTYKESKDSSFSSYSYLNLLMNTNEEKFVQINDWITDTGDLENISVSLEYQAGSLPKNENEVDYVSIVGFAPIPFNITEGGLQLGWINEELTSDNTKSFLNIINMNYQSPLNWSEACWKEPSRVSKLSEKTKAKRKVLVDVGFLQDIYSQMNQYLSTESKPTQKEWEISTLNQLSELLDPIKSSRYTIKMKKLSAKDIRDIFLEIQSKYSFGVNLFSPDEIKKCCGSKSGGSSSGRVLFLEKLILYIEILLNQNIHPKIEPGDVSAGSRPEDSARLVRKLCDAALTPQCSCETGVQLVHEKLNNSTQYLSGSHSKVMRVLSPRLG